jgi:hypothetical protein
VGLAWAIDAIPISVPLATAAYWVVVVAAVLGTVGLFTRTSWLFCAVASLYVLGIPQLSGSAFHYHHLVWFAAILAASPSGDALSIDAWIARRRGRHVPNAPTLAHGVPLRFVWLLIGLVFFFPGLWKILESGADWIFSDNLRNQMYAKWFQKPWLELPFRIDQHPTLLRMGALSVVVLELSFVVLVLFRRTRLAAVAGALVFHQLTAYFMDLRFPALWMTYVVFVPWTDVVRSLRRRLGRPVESPTVGAERPPGPALLAVGAILLAGNLAYGALGISDGWPFACYPKFHRTVAARLPVMEVELVYDDGETRIVPVEWMSPGGLSQRWWALSWSLLGSHERERADASRFDAFFRQVCVRGPLAEASRAARAVRFYKLYVSTIPEEADDPPLSRELLAELPLPRPP